MRRVFGKKRKKKGSKKVSTSCFLHHFTICQEAFHISAQFSNKSSQTLKTTMAVWNKKTVWSFMFLLAGVAGELVNYQRPVCAVKGSTVTLPCTFTPLKSFNQNGKEVPLRIVRVLWCVNHEICHGTTPSVYDSNSTMPNSRYQYLGDKKGNCTLQIRNIQMIDNTTFRFRMEVNNTEGHFTGRSGVIVTVTELVRMRINSSSDAGELSQNQKVTLSCTTTTTTCTVHQLEVTWFKDGNALPQSGPALQLGPLTAKDSGNYTCGLKSNTNTISPPYTVRVEEAGAGSNLPLIAGLVFGVLLLLFTLILVLFIIRRRRSAADDGQAAMGGELDQKHPDATYSSITEAAEQKRAERQQEVRQEVRPAAEDVNYAAVQFKHKNQARAAEEEVDAVIYSAVASRR
ncbi:V-set and immunoglobulin domain-containing protein 2-like isoform X2 [Thunnus albacares]|uniref:V-set and immunoglobulin domain-containing protein 2-like isoform X2 n=1 Tax=Thunnus albacares TaxID=8236 RepID=UPI001CF6C17C|nr:V-set and immunoglobulin domain-containing protein 2-like isoform X2 [Thunnus albacares]